MVLVLLLCILRKETLDVSSGLSFQFGSSDVCTHEGGLFENGKLCCVGCPLVVVCQHMPDLLCLAGI